MYPQKAPVKGAFCTDECAHGKAVKMQLVSDIEAGKMAHALVMDMSRSGRNYFQTGFYAEVLFRQYERVRRRTNNSELFKR